MALETLNAGVAAFNSGAPIALTAGTDGYVLLTSGLTPDTESYFQQVLVSESNEDIVTDPSGYRQCYREARAQELSDKG